MSYDPDKEREALPGETPCPAERRKRTRIPVQEGLVVDIVTASGDELPARVVDVSFGGLAVRMTENLSQNPSQPAPLSPLSRSPDGSGIGSKACGLAPGQEVQVRFRLGVIAGAVKYVGSASDPFRVGIEWNPPLSRQWEIVIRKLLETR